ncbi:MAG TPA: twin-arginine translocase TatA/TatE family subunit [Thermoleophilaceae bacterium]|nr:twin-arginine translocase TatA/TatE family subunit [Thermoleophilaceae bacterium]
MFNISPLEIMVLAVIALIVLGPQRLPEMARSLGRGMREFRAALSADDTDGPKRRRD